MSIEKIIITIKNCANIDSADIEIHHGKINIKFGNNGVGKTTILRAIEGKGNNDRSMISELQQYLSDKRPDVEVKGFLGKVIAFNESYIDQFLFIQDDLLANSHNILIENDEYKRDIEEINKIVSSLKNTISNNDEIKKHIANLNSFIDSVKVTSLGNIHGLSTLKKSFKDGNKFEKIPPCAVPYGDLIRIPSWIKWHKEGTDTFYKTEDQNCPFCTNKPGDNQIQSIKSISNIFTPSDVKNLVKNLKTLDNLSLLVTDDSFKNIDTVKNSTEELSEESESFILRLRNEAEELVEKLEKVQFIDIHQIKNAKNLEYKKELLSYRINETLYSNFNTDTLRKISESVNSAIDHIITQIGDLEGKLNIHNKRIGKIVEKNSTEINDFLCYAGFNYHVKLIEENNQFKLKLFPLKSTKFVENVKNSLSYGEKNVFAITLFLFEAINEDYDIIILDDPISSFDMTKKFAIMHRLFKGPNSLVNRTVLLATHDFDVVLDLGYVKAIHYNTNITYLQNDSGILLEKTITRNDISSYKKICLENIFKYKSSFISLIYIRKLLYLTKDVNEIINLSWNYVSNILHREKTDYKKRIYSSNGGKDKMVREVSMTKKEIDDSISYINSTYEIDTMSCSYQIQNITLQEITDLYKNEESRYVKLQLFRIIIEMDNIKYKEKDSETIMLKFINETYHNENDYLYDLNPNNFERIPGYIITWCDNYLDSRPSNNLKI